eukprot:1454390-Amphidinium_carterae.1
MNRGGMVLQSPPQINKSLLNYNLEPEHDIKMSFRFGAYVLHFRGFVGNRTVKHSILSGMLVRMVLEII